MAKKAKRRLVEGAVDAASDYLPDVVEGPLRRLLGMSDLAITPKPKRASDLAAKPRQLALPAPPRQLALPAPGPGLPPLASKPRGGQFWPDVSVKGAQFPAEPGSVDDILNGLMENQSPEAAARFTAAVTPEHVDGYRDWLQRAVAKYYKTDFGAPEDPLRDLAERGLHYEPDMTPERWESTVNSYLMEDPIGAYTVPGTSGYNPEASQELLAAAPWLAKQPVTDMLYGIQSGGLDLSHFNDEFGTALRVGAGDESSIPLDFAVRPESLGRMTFPQAVEHVGKINQYRAKDMERAALDAQNNPVTHVFKEYADDNPMGLKWVEMAPPKGDGPTNYDVEEELRKALKYEGDTMGHCVGGYCDDVMSGRSRIFSLRDAKGEPHVTIETKPRAPWIDLDDAANDDQDFGDAWNQWRYGRDISRTPGRPESTFEDYLRENEPDLLSRFEEQRSSPDDIIQIKGKQNRAPKDDYLPFVQDFVNSQPWSNINDLFNAQLVQLPDGRYINDLRNTQLVLLPDGRYITQQQAEEGIAATPLGTGPEVYDPRYLHGMGPDVWAKIARHFEGYAIGGRVSADRCFTRNPLSVR